MAGDEERAGEGAELDLAELSRASRVSPRTIRYYIHQGLLASPGKRGRGARYDRGLLDRLQLIQLLQRDKWPLNKIRDHMAELDDEGVRRELGAPPELALGEPTALGYVRSVLDSPSVRSRSRGGFLSKVGRREPPDVQVTRAPMPIPAAVHQTREWEMRRSTWERVRIGPNVELSIRTPLSTEERKLVDRLIEAAKEIFAEE